MSLALMAGWLMRILVAEAILLSLGAVGMVLCRQPARRVVIARSVLAGSLVMIPVMMVGPASWWPAKWPRLTWVEVPGLITMMREASIPHAQVGGCVLVCAYAGLSGALLGWTLLGMWASRRLCARSVAPHEDVQAAYQAIAAPFRRVPSLRVCIRARGPMLLGAVRPVIVIPPTLNDPLRLDDARLALLHELEHRERGDLRSVLLASVVQTCLPVLPMVWWIRAQLILDQEFLADRGAASRLGTVGDYASSLVSLAREPASNPVPQAKGAGPGHSLMLRVLMLVRTPFLVETRVPSWWKSFVSVVVGLSVWTTCGWIRPMASGPPTPTPTQAVHGNFRLAHLVVTPAPAGSDGRVRPYRVMCPCPESFELSVEVWSAPRDLPRIEVAGVSLALCSEHTGEAFHQVRIERKAGRDLAWIDDQPIPAPTHVPGSRWVEFRPAPGVTGRYRNLVVRW